MSNLKYVSGEGVPKPVLPYSPAVEAGDYLFVAGQASVDLDSKIITASFEEECRRSLDNLKAIVKAAGYTMRDIVSVKSYVSKQEDLPRYNEIYREYFEEPYPARTTLIGCLGDMLKFEVDVIVYTKNGK